MRIQPPYGFKDIVALSKTHRVLLPKGPTLPLAFRTMNPIPVSYAEFPVACHDYPIVFISLNQSEQFAPVLVLGVAEHQNLFVTAENSWASHTYLPAYVRRYPFCMSRITVDGKEAPERIACVEKLALNDKGDPLFDAQGLALPDWQQRQKLLFDYEIDLARTQEMCRLLAQHQLFEPFVMHAAPDQGEPVQLTGMFRVAETKLNALEATVLQELVQKGIMGRVYAHLLSLENFQRLVQRRAQFTQTAAAGKPEAKRLN